METEQPIEQLRSLDICESLRLKLLGNVIAIQPLANTFLTVGGIMLDDEFELSDYETKMHRLSIACNSIRWIVREEFRGRLVDASDLLTNNYKFVMLYRDKLISLTHRVDFDDYRVSVEESVTKDQHLADYRLSGSLMTSRQSLKQDVDQLIDEFNTYKTKIKGDE